jgi:hypothetical protein
VGAVCSELMRDGFEREFKVIVDMDMMMILIRNSVRKVHEEQRIDQFFY